MIVCMDLLLDPVLLLALVFMLCILFCYLFSNYGF